LLVLSAVSKLVMLFDVLKTYQIEEFEIKTSQFYYAGGLFVLEIVLYFRLKQPILERISLRTYIFTIYGAVLMLFLLLNRDVSQPAGTLMANFNQE